MKVLMLFAVANALLASGPASARQSRAIQDPTQPEARNALVEASACVVKSSPGEAANLLRMDFRSKSYKDKMQRLAYNNVKCFNERWMRAHGLLVAGDLAEHLLSNSSKKINVRLASLSQTVSLTPRSPTDAVAICVARSDPNGVARLFSTKVVSSEETAAAEALSIAMNRCNVKGIKMSVSPAGLRAMVATATFRLLEGQES